jgi:HD-GYP domain-containing protein (c-di-GMP phosphodiesterase class II)
MVMTPRKYTADMDADAMQDPLEAILALNMGDFVTEHLISEELLRKISGSVSNRPDRLKRQLEELVQIYSLKNTLSVLGFSPDDGAVLYDSIALSLANIFQADACHIFQIAQKSDQDMFLGLVGTSSPNIPVSRWHLGYSFSGPTLPAVVQCYQEQRTRLFETSESSASLWPSVEGLNQDRTRCVLMAPMSDSGKGIGVIVIERYHSQAFKSELVELADATANLLVVSLHLQRCLTQAQTLLWDDNPPMGEMQNLRAQITESIADLSRFQQQFVETLSMAIDARNDYTRGHAQGVAQLAKRLAETLELNEKTVDLVYYAGLMGSLGKMSVAQDILTKRDALTSQEQTELMNHPNVGVALLMKINFLSEVIPYVNHQKERWDGQGKPDGLKGRSIPLGSRLLGVCDAYWALCHPRPYREAPLTSTEALHVLHCEAGQKWDPDLVSALSQMVAESDDV